MLHMFEHTSGKYPGRTEVNASHAKATAAFAVDYTTGGERMTKRVAGDKYVRADLSLSPADAAQVVALFMAAKGADTLNVAGNGIHTLHKHGWNQRQVNKWVFETLSKVRELTPLSGIICGGQTGADIAGAVAGVALGISTIVVMPKGFIQRHEDGKDVEHTAQEIADGIYAMAMDVIEDPVDLPTGPGPERASSATQEGASSSWL